MTEERRKYGRTKIGDNVGCNPTIIEKRRNCILDCDSPSYPPQKEEYVQCGCRSCLVELKKINNR